MALRGRSGKDVKKSSYYVWYLGAREAKGVDAMPSAIDYLLERERLQEPFKVTLQVSSKGLKIIQTVHPNGSTRSAVKQLVPGHAVLAAVQREDVVAATLLLPNPATNNPVHVHAYRCDSVETAELLGSQLKLLATHSESSLARLGSLQHQDTRLRSNLGSDGRSTRESESSEGSGELRHVMPIQATSIYESLAAELRAKLGRGNSVESETGPLLLPPRDYDTVHRARGNLTGIELRRCLNQSIVGHNGLTTSPTSQQQQQQQIGTGITPIVQESRLSGGGVGGTRSAGSSGIGSDSAATPPPYQPHHPLSQRPSRPTRDSSSDDDWAGVGEEPDYLGTEPTSVSLPRVARSPERSAPMPCKPSRQLSPALHQQQHHHLQNGLRSANQMQHQQQQGPIRRSAEHRQRSPSPLQYRSRTTTSGSGQQQQQPLDPALMLASPRERFHDAKELFRQMEREAGVTRPIVARINPRTENALNCRPQLHRSEPVSRQSSHEEPPVQAETNPRSIRSQHQFGQSPTMQTITSGSGGGALNGCLSPQQQQHERLMRRGAMPHHHDRQQQQQQQLQPLTEQQQQQHLATENELQQGFNRNGRTRPRAQHFAGPMHHELEQTRPRPRSFYEVPMAARELRGPRNPADGVREARDFSRALQQGRDRQHLQQQQRPRPFTYGELAEHERYPGLDRENARPPLEIGSGPARYRHSYAEPPRLGLAALHPY